MRKCAPLSAWHSSPSVSDTAPTALNVLAIWSSSSTRSVTITNDQLPVSLRSTFCAKNTIEKLLPLPWVCQKTPPRPWPSFCASCIEAIALLTPRNWWFWPRILTSPALCSLNSVKFSTRSNSRALSQVPRSMTSSDTRRGSSSRSTRFHSKNRSQSAVREPTRLSVPLLAISSALQENSAGTCCL